MLEGKFLFFGVIRSGRDVEGGTTNVQFKCGHCSYGTNNGLRYPGQRDWMGKQGAEQGDRIGMLLDLDQGSMTVWKNDVKLGVMVAKGLRGNLCWAVTLGMAGDSARIESAPLPQDEDTPSV